MVVEVDAGGLQGRYRVRFLMLGTEHILDRVSIHSMHRIPCHISTAFALFIPLLRGF